MCNEEKQELIIKLELRLDSIKKKISKHPNPSLQIEKDRIKREIKELKMTMTEEDFEQMMRERSEINTSRC